MSNLSDAMRIALKKSKEKPMIIGDDFTPLRVKHVLSTGLPNLDRILCVSENDKWGLPYGKIVSLMSKPSVGKTTFLLRIADRAVRLGGAAHFIESEHALDFKYAKRLCTEFDKFLISQPDSLEDAFETVRISTNLCMEARKIEGSKAPYIILMDSFSGFSPVSELEGNFSTSGKSLGEHARIASMACRMLTGPISKANVIFILSHQTKSKIGVFWGNPDTKIGGDAFNFHDSISLTFGRRAQIKGKNKKPIGHWGVIKTTKNKLYPPFKEVNFKLINGVGFSRTFAIFDDLLKRGLIKKKGAWFNFADKPELKWQGADGFGEFIKGNKKAKAFMRKLL